MKRSAHGSKPASGRFLLRLTPEHHAALRMEARDQGVSLNEYCVHRLALPGQSVADRDSPVSLVMRAIEMFGDELEGVVAFGSWARCEEASESDIDILVIVTTDVTIDRALYRKWDEAPVLWRQRLVDPHFAHLPPGHEAGSGLWAEIARDGIVLYERSHRVSRLLAAVRQRLLAGRMVRREVFGQPYWMEAPDAKP